jgi:predicted SAM-dependent methyltransferase
MRSLAEYLATTNEKSRILNIGCGHKNPPECFGVDILPLQGVDLVHDCNERIPLPDATFDIVIALDFIEHVDQKKSIQLMEEIYRVLKPGGRLKFEVPSTDGNNMGAFQDPTHNSWWCEKKFWYFLDDQYGQGFRSLYNIRCWFIPRHLETFFNTYNVTYVRGILEKQA